MLRLKIKDKKLKSLKVRLGKLSTLVERGFSTLRKHYKRREGEAGFTLIEIMVASMILLIIISGAGLIVSKNIGKAKVTSARNQVQIFTMALNSYFLDCGIYPTTDQGLKALIDPPVLAPVPNGWDGPYLDKEAIPQDPWGNEYEYTSPTPDGKFPFGIRSLGRDGVEGGEKEDRDITSWGN